MDNPVEQPFEVGQPVLYKNLRGVISDVDVALAGIDGTFIIVNTGTSKVSVPSAKANQTLTRLTQNTSDWEGVQVLLAHPPKSLAKWWHRHLTKRFPAIFGTSSIEELCAVLRDTAERDKQTSPLQREVFNVAWTQLVDRYTVAFGVDQAVAEQVLREWCKPYFAVPEKAYGQKTLEAAKVGRPRQRLPTLGSVAAPLAVVHQPHALPPPIAPRVQLAAPTPVSQPVKPLAERAGRGLSKTQKPAKPTVPSAGGNDNKRLEQENATLLARVAQLEEQLKRGGEDFDRLSTQLADVQNRVRFANQQTVDTETKLRQERGAKLRIERELSAVVANLQAKIQTLQVAAATPLPQLADAEDKKLLRTLRRRITTQKKQIAVL